MIWGVLGLLLWEKGDINMEFEEEVCSIGF